MARPDGVVIASERFFAFAGRDGSLLEGEMPDVPRLVRRIPLLRGLAEQLQQKGVSSRIDVHPPDAAIRPPRARGSGVTGTQFGLYVRAEDVALARQIQSEHLKQVVPDAHTLSPESDAVLSDCPACGASRSITSART